MPTYLEYNTEDGATVLIELADSPSNPMRSAHDDMAVIKTGKRLTEAFISIRSTIKELMMEMNALHVEEGEVKFGLRALAEVGGFAVGKVGGEINYEVTLRWRKPKLE